MKESVSYTGKCKPLFENIQVLAVMELYHISQSFQGKNDIFQVVPL